MKYALVTFGCRVNQADSFVIEEQLRARGGSSVPPEQADLLIVNTCSVTASADQGGRHTIRRIVRANPDVKVVVTGCYATRQPEDLRALPNVALIVENSRKDSIADLMAERHVLSTAERFGDDDGPCGGTLAPGVAGRTALSLRVQTGCEERCSYCIIPQTRGRSRSRPAATVLEDVRRAVAAGYKEIWITGVHLGSYGRDLGDGSSLLSLLRSLDAFDADVLFRVSSLEPMDCTREIVDLVAGSSRLAPHFHLPLQHGSDEVLRAMRRPYTGSYYSSLVDYIAMKMPHASIGSDVIAGFPGESDAHFDETRSRVEAAPLSYLHVFPYSDRPGTTATALREKVDGGAIRARGAELRAIGARLSARFRGLQAGQVRRALTIDDGRSAVTDNFLKVRLPGQHPRNAWVSVTIES